MRRFAGRFGGRRLAALLLAAPLTFAISVGALAAAGGLTQKPGKAGCITNTENGSSDGCAQARALVVPSAVAVSPNGKSTYVGGLDHVAIFTRRAAGGGLTEKAGAVGCIVETGSPQGTCASARNIDDVESIAVSPDGSSVYMANGIGGGVAVFDRNKASGALSQKAGTAGCFAVLGLNGCTAENGGGSATSVAVSPDGENVYVADRVLAIFDRDPATGALTQKPGRFGCYSNDGTDSQGDECAEGTALDHVNSVAVSPNGKNVYAASSDSDAVAIFGRGANGGLAQKSGKAGCVSENGTGGACANGRGLEGASIVTVSPSGTSAYVSSRSANTVATFDRSTANGKLTQKPGKAGCISEDGTGGACLNGRALAVADAMVVSPGGANVYVASRDSDAIAILDRSGDGTLSQPSGKAGCISDDGTGGACGNGRALDGPGDVTVSPDADNVYVASGESNAVSIFDREGSTKPPPPGGGPGDTTPPDLKVVKKPKKKIKSKHRKVKVKVRFSSETGATFKCKLDKKDFKPCTSPYKAKLKAGKHHAKRHTIRIVATDAAGNASDAKKVKVKVKRKG
jgi:DNA-binding beta-propeller fold protein YncE